MNENNSPKKKIYGVKVIKRCIHCDKNPDFTDCIEKTLIFEHCGVEDITKTVGNFFGEIYFRNQPVKITIMVAEE